MLRDDIIEYSLDAHHSEEEGKKKRKEIWKVTAILSIITAVEVLIGVFYPKDAAGAAWEFIKWGYIILTVIKAGYIVMVFMHLGDERKTFRMMVLVPYIIFILYLLFQVLNEGAAVGATWNEFRV